MFANEECVQDGNSVLGDVCPSGQLIKTPKLTLLFIYIYIFFNLKGFLITSHLLKETQSGMVRLPQWGSKSSTTTVQLVPGNQVHHLNENWEFGNIPHLNCASIHGGREKISTNMEIK